VICTNRSPVLRAWILTDGRVITKLGCVNTLTVPSSSVDKYRNQIVDPKKVAADLNVDTLLTGSFMKDGDDLRINAPLIDVKPDRILWRDSIDLKYDNLLTVQDRVARQTVGENTTGWNMNLWRPSRTPPRLQPALGTNVESSAKRTGTTHPV